jgi:hypothetical protein
MTSRTVTGDSSNIVELSTDSTSDLELGIHTLNLANVELDATVSHPVSISNEHITSQLSIESVEPTNISRVLRVSTLSSTNSGAKNSEVENQINDIQPVQEITGPELQPKSVTIHSHFENIEMAILQYLKLCDGAKICAAWLTSEKLVEQLSVMGEIGLIIGSTEKLTPGNPEYKSQWVHTLLRDLPNMVYVYRGVAGRGLMHNKFIVLLRENQPYAVITGSFNYTYSANTNWENIVYIESEEIALSYLEEYNKILRFCVSLSTYTRP